MIERKSEHLLVRFVLASLLILGAAPAQSGVTTVGGTTVTNTVDFHRGLLDFFLGYYFSYNYTITTNVSHNDIHLGFRSAGDMDIGSYGDNGGGTPSFAGDTLVINSPTAMPATMSLHIDTVRNPASLTGSQAFALSQDGVIIPGTRTTLPSVPATNTGFLHGLLVLQFLAGTFDPLADIDLFQNGQNAPYIGFGQANVDGSATVALSRPLLGGEDLFVSQNGTLAFSAAVVAEPDSLLLALLAITLGLGVSRRRPPAPLPSAAALGAGSTDMAA